MENLPAITIEGAADSSNSGSSNDNNSYVPANTAAGSKTDTPLRELPQTVNVVTAKQMREQGVQTVGQALRYTPGVYGESFGAGSQFDAYTQIRGFQADYFLDGMRLPNGTTSSGWASAVTEPYGLERVEVLKGPSSGLYGQTVPGGLINMTSKRPTENPFGEVQVQGGSFDRKQAAIDIGGPIDKDKHFLYRLTALGRDSDTQIDYMENNRTYIAPAFTWRPSADTSLTILTNYQKDWGGKTGFNYVPTSGTLVQNPNGRIPFNRYLGDPYFDQFTRQQAGLGYLFEHHLNNAVTFRQGLRYFEGEASLRALNRSGELLADNQTIKRLAFGIATGARALTIDNNGEFKFATGALSHTALVGVDYRRENNHYNVGAGGAPTINVFNPVYGVAITDPGTSNFQRTTVTDYQVGAYAQDQIKFGRWVATVGGRFDQANANSAEAVKNVYATQRDDAWTWRAGVNYLFDNGVTPYISYSTSFRPTPGMDFFGTPYKPTTGQQYEAGIKYQPPGSRTLITLSAFDLTQQNRQTNDPDPTHVGFFVQTGEVNIRGIEVESRTELARGLNVIAAYSHLNDEVTKSSIPADIGRHVAQTPADQASLWAMYDVQSGPFAGLGFGGGARYIGHTFDISNATVTPDYTLYDARIQYDLSYLSPKWKGATLAVNGLNLADKYYLTECTTGQGCTLGYRRTVLATLTYRW